MGLKFKCSKLAYTTHLLEITCLLLIIECLYKVFSDSNTFLGIDVDSSCLDL